MRKRVWIRKWERIPWGSPAAVAASVSIDREVADRVPAEDPEVAEGPGTVEDPEVAEDPVEEEGPEGAEGPVAAVVSAPATEEDHVDRQMCQTPVSTCETQDHAGRRPRDRGVVGVEGDVCM